MQINLSFVSIIKLITRIVARHVAAVSAMHKVTLFLVHKITLLAIRIEIMEVFTSLLVNIKPIRLITYISRAHQLYRVSKNH